MMELKGDREIVITRTFNGPARIVFDAWEVRDIIIASGMEHGMRETMEQFEELIATLR